MRYLAAVLALVSLAAMPPGQAQAQAHKECEHEKAAEAASGVAGREATPAATAAVEERADVDLPAPVIPDLEVLDQDGRTRRFYADLVKDRVVVIQFIFTTCTTICKPLSAVFTQLQKALGPESDVRLISISVDPATDVPARLRAYADRFHSGPNWTFVTGDKGRIDAILKALGAYTPDKLTHTAFVLAGNDRTGKWVRTYGLATAATLVEKVKIVASAKDREWFTDLPVLDQAGNRLRFFSDVLEGKLVVVDFIFTRCTSICPLLTSTMKGVREQLSDLMGDEVRLVSISVDPDYDTPEVLDLFARKYGAGKGWTFLTGKKENVDWILHKLGAWTSEKESHASFFLIGDTVTNRWSRVLGTAPPAEIAAVARTLLAQRRG
jgi:cytochrome oxidase Cu insertion factor (SCO1/SenC/PrrC family)